jgi:hypothetical protein
LAQIVCLDNEVESAKVIGETGEKSLSDCVMVKQLGDRTWQNGIVDLLGYLF